jgi:hypothetical protein
MPRPPDATPTNTTPWTLSHRPGSVRALRSLSAMGQRFVAGDRDHAFLLPPGHGSHDHPRAWRTRWRAVSFRATSPRRSACRRRRSASIWRASAPGPRANIRRAVPRAPSSRAAASAVDLRIGHVRLHDSGARAPHPRRRHPRPASASADEPRARRGACLALRRLRARGARPPSPAAARSEQPAAGGRHASAWSRSCATRSRRPLTG